MAEDELTEVTLRLYNAAQVQFIQWCRTEKASFPPLLTVIGRYLQHVNAERGADTVGVHSAAIGRYLRNNGLQYDTKAEPIAGILQAAREVANFRRGDGPAPVKRLRKKRAKRMGPAQGRLL